MVSSSLRVKRKCRNWQTSKTKDLVINAIVWVQVPSSALTNNFPLTEGEILYKGNTLSGAGMDFGEFKKSQKFEKQRKLLMGLIVACAVLFIITLFSTLSRVMVEKQLDEANEAVLSAQSEMSSYKESNESLSRMYEDLGNTVVAKDSEIASLKSQVSTMAAEIDELKVYKRKYEEEHQDEQTPHEFTDKNGDSFTFSADEWNYFMDLWEYTGDAESMAARHTVEELKQELKNRDE